MSLTGIRQALGRTAKTGWQSTDDPSRMIGPFDNGFAIVNWFNSLKSFKVIFDLDKFSGEFEWDYTDPDPATDGDLAIPGENPWGSLHQRLKDTFAAQDDTYNQWLIGVSAEYLNIVSGSPLRQVAPGVLVALSEMFVQSPDGDPLSQFIWNVSNPVKSTTDGKFYVVPPATITAAGSDWSMGPGIDLTGDVDFQFLGQTISYASHSVSGTIKILRTGGWG